MKKRNWLAIAAPMLLLMTVPAATQEQEPNSADSQAILAFAAVGAGPGSRGTAFNASLSGSYGPHNLIVRFVQTHHFTFIFGESGVVPRDIALLYGLRHSLPRGWLRAAAGLGRARLGEVTNCNAVIFCDYGREAPATTGLAWQLDAVWAPSRVFGLGLSTSATSTPSNTSGV